MNSEVVKSKSESIDSNNNQSVNNETISVRLARYLEHIRNLKKENTESLIKEAETRLVKQKQLHNSDLEELCEQYEAQLQDNREKLEKILKAKLKSVETASQRDKDALEHATKSLSVNKNLVGESESRVSVLEQTNSALNETVHNLQSSVEVERTQANKLENEVKRLQKELASKIEEYQQLVNEEMDNSIGVEIAAFNHLLSQEEKRIKLSTTASQVFANSSEMESQ